MTKMKMAENGSSFFFFVFSSHRDVLVYSFNFIRPCYVKAHFGDQLITVVNVFTFQCVVIKVQWLPWTKCCNISLSCCSDSTLRHVCNDLVKNKNRPTLSINEIYLPALAWVTIAQFAMRGAFHLMIKKFRQNTTFRTLSNRIPSVSGRKILKRTEILLYSAAVHQTIFTVNPMTGTPPCEPAITN